MKDYEQGQIDLLVKIKKDFLELLDKKTEGADLMLDVLQLVKNLEPIKKQR